MSGPLLKVEIAETQLRYIKPLFHACKLSDIMRSAVDNLTRKKYEQIMFRNLYLMYIVLIDTLLYILHRLKNNVKK